MIRPARVEEIPEIQSILDSQGYEWLKVEEGICFVWEDGKVIRGILPARLVWEIEPLILLEPSKFAMYGLVEEAEKWIASPANKTGVRAIYAHVTDQVAVWAKETGWHEVYASMRHFVKYLPKL